MRLVTRLTATAALSGLVVFSGFGLWLVAREQRDLRTAVEREATFLASSLRVGVENALRDRQLPDVEEATLRLEGVGAAVDVLVFDRQGAPVVAPSGMPEGALRAELAGLVAEAARTGETRMRYAPEGAPHVLLLATPLLSDDGDPEGQLAIVRPLDDVDQDLLETSGSIAVTVGGFVLLASGIGLFVGQVRLGAPLDRLAAAMRRVRAGELDALPDEGGDDELAALAAEFNRMVRDLAEARHTAKSEAEARREALRTLQTADRLVTIGQLSAAVAHEIGSPLQVLHGRARALVERPDDPERTRRTAEILVRESERISRIVSQLLTVTRRRGARREPIDLLASAREVTALLEIEARRRRVTLDAEGEPVRVGADPDQVQQVLLNLLTNALAACAEGGRIAVRVAPNGSGGRIEVEDDGAGMSEETARRAFEPLFTTRAGEGGAGLGLVVARSIVDAHGGTISFDSRPGHGTTFRVELPATGSGA